MAWKQKSQMKKIVSVSFLIIIDQRLKQINKEIEAIKVTDIDDRLAKLQNLIKFAKS